MIRNQSFLRNVFTGLLLLTYVVIVVIVWPSVVMAQGPAPFLSTPYYGTKGINAYYDHTFPFSQNQNVRYFDGRLGTIPNCNANFNRAYATTSGECLYYDGHEGIDFNLSYEPVLTAASGTVTQRGWEDPNNRSVGYGLFIDIQHTVNVGGQNVVYTTRYGHLSATAVLVNEVVQAGQIIGSSGNTGNSTGAHLHFGVLNQSNQNTDPFGWTGVGADPSGVGSVCLWKDGEWANFCGGVSRPIPAPINSGETTIDDNTGNLNGFSKGNGGHFNNSCTGNCVNWTLTNNAYYGSVNSITENKWARWQPTIPTGGAVYEILVFIPSTAPITATQQAPYTIIHAGGTKTAVVDQLGSRGRWISIGTYLMDPGHSVYVTDASGEAAGTRRVGADSVKFIRRGVVHMPDVRYSNSGGSSSNLIIRNNGGGPATTLVKFFRNNGALGCLASYTLSAHQILIVACGDSLLTAASAEGSQDLSVVVRTSAAGLATLDNGFLAGNTVDPAFEQIGTTLYAPAIYNNIFGGFNSTVYIQNTSGVANNVTLIFRGRTGYANQLPVPISLNPNGSASYNINTLLGTTAWVGSLKLTANQPVAAKIVEGQGSTVSRSYSATASGNALLYVPAAYRNAFGLNTGLVIKNLHSTSATDVTVTYCPRQVTTTNPCVSEAAVNLAAETAYGVNLAASTVIVDGWNGSVRIVSSSSIPLSVAATNSKSIGGYDASGANKGSKVVVLPWASRSTCYLLQMHCAFRVSRECVARARTIFTWRIASGPCHAPSWCPNFAPT